MRVPRIYTDGNLPKLGQFKLGEDQSHYLSKVLRMEAGRPLILFNGDGVEYSATIIDSDKRATIVEIQQSSIVNRESTLATHLAIGVSRGDRMDWVLQKATELGVTSVTPIFTERTEVRLSGDRLDKKMGHWQQIIISACEQCQRNVLPKLNSACNFSDFLKIHNEDLKLILHHRSHHTLKNRPTPTAVTLLVGPEGGLSAIEIESALHSGYEALTLGPRVLRTETAPVAALTAVQLQWGDLG
jgi:16S rRNA (uracil1498-N3)-methyltransferase